MNTLYSQLPAIDSLLRQPAFAALIAQYGRQHVTAILRQQQQDARHLISRQQRLPDWYPDWHQETQRRLCSAQRHALSQVFNLSGTVLHTNLGRAQLAEQAIAAACVAMREPVTLEYDLSGAQRSHRDRALAQRLCQLTGAEDACIVNNNAAAVLLLLSALASAKDVLVSRGELVEIGGSFRIPDIMRQAGCTLREVGTTNRTHLHDYQQAIGEQTALLMKVHTSNYQINGFTGCVSESALATLSKRHGLVLVADLGSGSLIDLTASGLPAEPMPQQLIADGDDLISFSGDKLLGGPQAGIIVGKRALIDRLQQHPLKRALRADKITLAALDATLALYQQPELLAQQLPTLNKLTRSQHILAEQAQRLLPALRAHFCAGWQVNAEPCLSQIGSGSLPVDRLPGYALTFMPTANGDSSLHALAAQLRQREIPVIGRLHNGKLWLDLRCLENEALFLETMLAPDSAP